MNLAGLTPNRCVGAVRLCAVGGAVKEHRQLHILGLQRPPWPEGWPSCINAWGAVSDARIGKAQTGQAQIQLSPDMGATLLAQFPIEPALAQAADTGALEQFRFILAEAMTQSIIVALEKEFRVQ